MMVKKVLLKGQFGFRQVRSTVGPVNNLVTEIVESLDNQHWAFPLTYPKHSTVSITAFWFRSCTSAGAEHGISQQRVQSSFANRTERVQIANQFSKSIVLKYGVPKGSILGPGLILLYVNNLPSALRFGQLVQ